MYRLAASTIKMIQDLRKSGKTFTQIQNTTGASMGAISKYTRQERPQETRLWGCNGKNEVIRKLSKKDIRRLKKGKEVRVQVNRIMVVLMMEHFVPPEQRKIAKLNEQITKLIAERDLLKGVTQ